jgi:hypothetical protein
MGHLEFWQKIESLLTDYNRSYAPVRWFRGWGGWTVGREGYFVLFRFIFLIALYLAAFSLPPHWWLKIPITVMAGCLTADMFLLPTSLAFGGIHAMRPLRALVFVFITYVSIAVAFGIFYVTLCRSSFHANLGMTDFIYFSFTVITALGTGGMILANQAVLVRFMIVSEVLTGFYFWAVVVGLIISWTGREFKS